MTTQASITLPTVTFKSGKIYTVVSLTGEPFTMSERSCVMSSWISILREPCSTSDQVIEVVLNLVCATLDDAAKELTKCQTVRVINKPIPKQDYLRWIGVEEKNGTWKEPQGLPRLPRLPTDTSSGLTNSLNAFSALGIILYCIGKEVSVDNTTAVTTNRPRIAHDRYGLSEDDFKSGPEKPDGPSVQSLNQVYNAFNVVTELRAMVIGCFLSIYIAQDHYAPELDVVMVMFRLIDGAQLTHVGVIQDMLEAHPWLTKIPALRPSIKVYIQELRRFANVPEKMRGFVRLLSGSQNMYFPAPQMGPLVAATVALKEKIDKTMVNYKGGRTQYQDVVAEVLVAEAHYKMKAGVDTLARDLGLPDVDAPAGSSLVSPTQSAPVLLTPKTQ